MTFRITISGGVNHFDTFHQGEGWEEFCSNDEDLKELYEKCCEVCPRDVDTIDLLMEQIKEMDIAEGFFGGYMQDPQPETFEVDDEEIENPFADHEKYEMPEPEDVFSEVKESKFCFVNVWENSEEWFFEGNGEFDISKLTYEVGKFLYDNKEFENNGGDGSSSYARFYRDGSPCGNYG